MSCNFKYQIQRWFRRWFTGIFIVLLVYSSNAGFAAVGKTQLVPDVMLLLDPSFGYPDCQRMTNISGQITVIYKAGGSYSFYSETEKGYREQVTFDLTMTLKYSRTGNQQKVITTVDGFKTITKDTPAHGRKATRTTAPDNYSPAYHVVETETYHGGNTQRVGNAIDKVVWSKEAKLVCFKANIGDDNSPYIHVPIQVHREEDTAVDGDHCKQTIDFETACGAAIPSLSTAHSRFANLVKEDSNLPESNSFPGWIESPSTQGTTSGSFTRTMFFEDVTWQPESAFRSRGINPRQTPESDQSIIWPGSVQVIWALGDKLPLGKMTLEAVDRDEYRNWIPSPCDDARYGNALPLSFTARILPQTDGKGGGGAAPQGRIHFWLTDVCHEKGKCTNYPVNGSTEDDLRFVSHQAGIVIDPQNPRHAYTEKPCSAATIDVEALDTGAYGRIQATCEELGLVAEDERTKLQSIDIPMDDNHNHIADVWEKSLGIYQKNYLATDDDDAEPAGQRRNGDGYTVYEEYRGFMTKDGFGRTTPLKKDLFVYDPDSLVKQWYEPYNPAKLVLHYIDPTMMKFTGVGNDPANRWVNCNSAEDKWYARQYAMFVKQWTTMSDQVVGEASSTVLTDRLNNIADNVDGFAQPLKKIYVVKVAPGTLEQCLADIKNPALKQEVSVKVMTTTIIHEMGHAMGIRHHREDNQETENSTKNGVFDCAMRYNQSSEYRHPELMKPQTRYCGADEIWQKSDTTTDAAGNKNVSFRDVPSDNCFGQIDVKSDP